MDFGDVIDPGGDLLGILLSVLDGMDVYALAFTVLLHHFVEHQVKLGLLRLVQRRLILSFFRSRSSMKTYLDFQISKRQ